MGSIGQTGAPPARPSPPPLGPVRAGRAELRVAGPAIGGAGRAGWPGGALPPEHRRAGGGTEPAGVRSCPAPPPAWPAPPAWRYGNFPASPRPRHLVTPVRRAAGAPAPSGWQSTVAPPAHRGKSRGPRAGRRGSPGPAGVPEALEVREDLGDLTGGMGVPD